MDLDQERIQRLTSWFSQKEVGVHAALGVLRGTVESLLNQMEFEDKVSGTRLTRSDAYVLAEETLEAYKKVFE